MRSLEDLAWERTRRALFEALWSLPSGGFIGAIIGGLLGLARTPGLRALDGVVLGAIEGAVQGTLLGALVGASWGLSEGCWRRMLASITIGALGGMLLVFLSSEWGGIFHRRLFGEVPPVGGLLGGLAFGLLIGLMAEARAADAARHVPK